MDSMSCSLRRGILDTELLVVPTLSLLEVFKRVLQQRGEGDALQAVALMRQGKWPRWMDRASTSGQREEEVKRVRESEWRWLIGKR